MMSKISCFDGAVFRRSLRKTLPLWICYLLFWLLLLPGGLLSMDYTPEHYGSLSGTLCNWILSHCTVGACISALIGLLAAWLLFSWLFHANASYFYASLPVRRETLFVTNFSVGITMVALCNLLTAIATYLITLLHGYPQLSACMSFFGASTLAFLGFYGFAVFLCMIIGQTAAMPAVYIILNFTSALVYYAVQYLLETFVYGMTVWYEDRTSSIFYRLSPVYYMAIRGFYHAPATLADGSIDESRYYLEGWGYLAALAAAGIVFTVLALLVFRRREMERSGDVIAVKPLRPVFLYSFTAGCAIVFAYVITSMQSGALYGAAAFRQTLLLLVLGAFFGYFIAQMLLRKTIAVFRGARTWLGFGAVCLVLILGCTAARLDIFGTFSRVPDVDDISSIYLTYGGTAHDKSDFEAVTQFQKLAIERRQENEASSGDGWADARFAYNLKDGTHMAYSYRIAAGEAEEKNADSLLCRYEALINSQTLILGRIGIPEEFCQDADSFVSCSIDAQDQQTLGASPRTRHLSGEEAYTFYMTCVLPDLKDTDLGQMHIFSPNGAEKDESGFIFVTFTMDPTDEALASLAAKYASPDGSPSTYSYSRSYDYTITKAAWRSAAYLENLGYSFEPVG